MNVFGMTPSTASDLTIDHGTHDADYHARLNATREHIDREAEKERDRAVAVHHAEIEAARRIDADRQPAPTDLAGIAAEIAALLTNERRLAIRGQSIGSDINMLRQDLDVVMRWVTSTLTAK